MDPISSAYFANLGSDLTGGVLKALRRRAEEFALGTPKYQALKRCYAAAELALLPPDAPQFETLRPYMQDFLVEPMVSAEMAKLVKGRTPDIDELVELFDDLAAERDLPAFDLAGRLPVAIEAFLQMAEQEPALQDDIQTAQLRDLVAVVTNLPAELTTAIEQMLQRLQPGSGDITFEKDANIQGDIITGLKIEVKPPAPAPPDPCLALGRRYLTALRRQVIALPLAALDDEGADSRRANVTLDQVYIALNVRRRIIFARTGPDKKEAMPEFMRRDEEPVSALQATAEHERLVLLGDPGSGKSVFVNYLAYRLAQAHLDNAPLPEPWPTPAQWPIHILLRELAAGLAAALDPTAMAALTPPRQDRQLLAAARAHLLEQFTLLDLTPAEARQWHTCLLGRPCLTIFDGLDEVPLAHLAWVRRVIELLAGRSRGPVIVTCRIRSYEGMEPLPGFASDTLAAFTGEQQAEFIAAWYRAQRHLTEPVRRLRIDDLRRAARDLPSDLTRNPLLLTTLALIHTSGTELPKQRAVLYARGVEVLMRRWQRHKHGRTSLLEQLDTSPDRLLEGLRKLAFEAHRVAGAGETADLDEDRAVGWLARSGLGSRQKAELFLAYVDRQAGLLVGRGGSPSAPPVYRFAHRTFQEYLAGCYLAARRDGLARTILPYLAEGERWYLATVLAAEHLLYNDVQPFPVLDLLYTLCPVTDPADDTDWRGVAWAGVIAAEMGADRIKADDAPDGGPQFLRRLLARLKAIVDAGRLTVTERAEAGAALARLGDDRPGVGVLTLRRGKQAVTLPDLAWCKVPAGPFLLGANKGEEDYGDEQQHRLTRPDFYVARYPVTNAQYRCFVQAGGYDFERYWTPAGWRWRQGDDPDLSHIEPKELRQFYEERLSDRPAEDRHEPFYWQIEPWNLANQPVVGVNWYEAMAYCAWLNDVIARPQVEAIPLTGEMASPAAHRDMPALWATLQAEIENHKSTIRLPTEAEWEKAAGWEPNTKRKRVYAWGDDWDTTQANVEGILNRTSVVGMYPTGAAACGALDMTGNVWEWTHSLARPYPYRADDGRENEDEDGNRVLRGGAWSISQRSARVSYRGVIQRDDFNVSLGFRLVVAPVLK